MAKSTGQRRGLPRPSTALVVTVGLVLVIVALAAVVVGNLTTSADIRKESREAYFLGEMQIAVTTVEESLATWQRAPDQHPHPASDPAVTAAVADFAFWADQLTGLIDEDEVPVVRGFEVAFDEYLQAVLIADANPGEEESRALVALDLAVRGPLLSLLNEESAHLLESVNADLRSEQALRWGFPLLLGLAIVLLIAVTRLQDRGRQLDEERKINEARRQFIASISHELRTPLTPVVALSHELEDRIHAFSAEEVAEFAGAIASGSDEVAAIVEDLIVAARIEAGQISVTREIVEIGDEVERALRSLDGGAHVAVSASGRALADGGRLRQILRSLISNAMRHGGGEIRVTTDHGRDEVVIAVSDNGPGIPPEFQDYVFEPFTSLRTDVGIPASVGLGLAVSRDLAMLMDGRLTYSRDGGWSRLDLVLPSADSR